MVTFVVLQFSIISAVGKAVHVSMLIGDQKKITQISKRRKPRTLLGSGFVAMANTKKTMEPLPFPRG